MKKINTCESLGNFFSFFLLLKGDQKNYCMPGGRYMDKQNKIMYTNRQEKYDVKLEDSYCPLGWILYKIGALSFRNKVKHDMNSIKKAEFMASVAKRIVDIILGTSGNYLLCFFVFFFFNKVNFGFFFF